MINSKRHKGQLIPAKNYFWLFISKKIPTLVLEIQPTKNVCSYFRVTYFLPLDPDGFDLHNHCLFKQKKNETIKFFPSGFETMTPETRQSLSFFIFPSQLFHFLHVSQKTDGLTKEEERRTVFEDGLIATSVNSVGVSFTTIISSKVLLKYPRLYRKKISWKHFAHWYSCLIELFEVKNFDPAFKLKKLWLLSVIWFNGKQIFAFRYFPYLFECPSIVIQI